MNKTISQKHPYVFVVLVGLLCTFMTALGSAVPQIIGLDVNSQIVVTTIFLIVSFAIGILIMKKSQFTLSEYGYKKSNKDTYKKVWWYLPILIIEIIPFVIAGLNSKVTYVQYIILIFFTVAVGFNEETYFRGLALKILEQKGSKKMIIWSSVIFGISHLGNALGGKNVFYLVLQMFFSFLFGFVLAEIVSITNSLWIVIIWHASHDYISCITSERLDTTSLIVLSIQVGVLLLYAVCLWRRSNIDNTVINGITN